MRCLNVVTISVLIVAGIDAHLQRNRLEHQSFVPIGSQFLPQHNLIDPLYPRHGLFRDGLPNQGRFPSFGQMPLIFNNQLAAWNGGVPPAQFESNSIFTNDVLSRTDPWEQYRRFNSGVETLSGRRTRANSISRPNQPIPGTISNYPWNTFATQNSFNIPAIPNIQGFVNPQLQSNQFQNQGFLTQGFLNNKLQNQDFLSQGARNSNRFQSQGTLTQGFQNGLPLSNGVFV